MAYDLPSVFCWAGVNQAAIAQGNQRSIRSIGNLPFVNVRSSGNTTLQNHSVKSPKKGDISRRLTQSRPLVMSPFPRVVS
jgi:hypothetical protein